VSASARVLANRRRFALGALAVAVSCIVALVSALLPLRAATPTADWRPTPNGAVEPAYFGIHMHSAHAGVAWPAIPVGSWRLWDAHVTWKDLQPARDRWEFKVLDHDVDLARQHGAEILLPLALSPRWASSRPDEPSAYGPGHAAPPGSLADWQAYVEQVVRRYRGRIAAYEIWNEPNAEAFFSGTAAQMVELTCAAQAVIRRLDPEARIVSPSATHGRKGIDWLHDFLAAGGAACVDVVGFHFYTLAHEPPEAMVELVQGVRAVMARHGLQGRALWNTEAGWYIRNATRPPTVRWHTLDNDSSVAFVGRALMLGLGLGLERFHWYAWDDGNLGLFELETAQPKPAARAYAAIAEWTRGARDVQCDTAARSLLTCRFEREGRTWRVVWSRGDPQHFVVPPEWRTVASLPLLGARRALAAGEALRIDARPVLLEPAP
jgi:hypothetical protein